MKRKLDARIVTSLWGHFLTSKLWLLLILMGMPRVWAAALENQGFESGLGAWTVEGGLWVVGTPTAAGGPAPFAGANVVGTGLTGIYGTTHDARLITPEFVVPAADQSPRFTYHYWYLIGVNDYGQLQIRTPGGAWEDVVGERLTEASGGSWARRSLDLRAYGGQTVQLAFRFFAIFNNSGGDRNLGWFIDEVKMETGPMSLAAPEGFESGFGDWSAEGGVWQAGTPSGTGAPPPLVGTKVVGTILAGNYGSFRDARLVTPEFVVPDADQTPRFSYHYWYLMGVNDYGQLQIRTLGGAWQDIAGERLTEAAGGSWSRRSVDLRAFAGQTVQLAFRLFASANNSAGDFNLGWYIDEAGLETGPMELAAPEGFENGFGDWSAEGGVWQVGTPSGAGAPPVFAGTKVAGTILAGNYGANRDARLITPEMVVPAASESPRFTYYYWYSIGGLDYGQLQIRQVGGAWQDIAGEQLTEIGGVWSRRSVDLRPYAGQNVQLAFRLVAIFQNRVGDLGLGWYVDNVALETGPMELTPDGFENGFGDWSAEGGVWQVGTPSGAGAPPLFAGTSMAGTILGGNYGTTHDARLVTPEFSVPPAGESPRFTYYYWYSLGILDHCQLEVRPVGGAWQDVAGERLVSIGGRWARRSVDLRPFAGQSVQLAFRLVAVYENRGGDLGLGWYVDEPKLETGPMQFNTPEGFENGFGDWSVEGGIWQIGTPSGTGSPAPYAGTSVAGTILDGNYPVSANARLVSPEFIVPPAPRAPQITFQHWRAIQANDGGRFQISVAQGPWISLSPVYTGNDMVWKPSSFDLTPYAGQQVRVGFLLTGDPFFVSRGWHIDELFLGTVDPVALTLGVQASGTLAASGARALYVLDAPPGGHLRFTFNDLDNLGANEIYVRRGAVPTAGAYDYRFPAGGADQSVFAPNAGAGPWFVLIIGANVPAGGSAFQLRADFTQGIGISSVTPARVGNIVPAILDVSGAGFDGTARIDLRSGATVVATGDTTFISADKLRADLALTGVAPGTYQVTVTQGANTASLPIEVIAGGVPRFEVHLIAPGRVGRHAPGTIIVEYANTGNVAMPAPLLLLHGSDRALLTLNGTLGARGLWTSARPRGFSDTVQFLASGITPGVLQPGERLRVPIYYSGLLAPWSFLGTPVQFTLGTFEYSNTAPVDWNAYKSTLRPVSIGPEAWDVLWANFSAAAGSTWGQYASMLAENASYLGKLGLNIKDVGELFAFEMLQADGLSAVSALASATDAFGSQPGLNLVFSRVFPQSISQRFRFGHLGWGWSHNWDYRLRRAGDGTVTMHGPVGAERTFQPDVRGGYFAEPANYSKLINLGAGRYEVRESRGGRMVFRADGLLEYIEDLNGNRITAAYSGNLLNSLTHSAGQKLRFTYSNGLLQTVTDPYDQVTTYTYDGAQNLSSVTHYGIGTVAYGYAAGPGKAREHALSSVSYPGGTHDYFTWDTQGRLTSTGSDGGAQLTTFSYNSVGNVFATDTSANQWNFLFEHRGLVSRVEDPLSNVARFSFDRNFNLTSMYGPDGNSSSFTYDALGNVTRGLDPLGHAMALNYTANSRLAKLTNARNHTTQFAYDSQSNLGSMIYPNGSMETYGSDATGEVTNRFNRRGLETALTRDNAGRIIRKITPEGRTNDFTYDSHGNLTNVTDSMLGAIRFAYDNRDLLTNMTHPNGRGFTFQYDAARRRTQRTSHDGYTLKYSYDAAGRLDHLEDGTGHQIVDYVYDANGRLVRENNGNSTWSTYDYDNAGQVLKLVNYGVNGAPISSYQYTYDPNGNRSSVSTLAGTINYTYDAIGQLTRVAYPNGRNVTYTYDPAGNRTAVNDNGVNTLYVANNLNQYLQVGGATLSYDGDGSLTNRIDTSSTTRYRFDSENRLVSVDSPADGTWQFIYDALGNRVATIHDGQTIEYLHDPTGDGNVVAAYHLQSATVERYDFGLGLASSVGADASRRYYQFDGSANASALTSSSGSILNQYEFDPFGLPLSSSETVENDFGFNARNGVMEACVRTSWVRSRYYDPGLGRFLTVDPIRFSSGEPNLYRYAINNPVSFHDPDGKRVRYYSDTRPEADDAYTYGGPYAEIFEFNGLRFSKLHFNDIMVNKAAFQGRWWQSDIETVLAHEWAHHNLNNLIAAGYAITKAENELIAYKAGFDEARRRNDWMGMITQSTYGVMFLWRHVFEQSILFPALDLYDSVISAIAAAFDPNEMVGPAGYGAANYLRGDVPFPYRINFENATNATAPAQVVVITNTIPANLDLATLEFTSVGFGDHFIVIPTGTQHFEHTEPATFNGTDFDVLIEASVDYATRQVLVKFNSIMPDTGLPPEVDVGFLPPEDGTFRGDGHAAYIIRPVAGLPTGTEIRNIGFISFDPLAGGATFRTDLVDPTDPNSGINTDRQALVTIDANVPASGVLTLPPDSETPHFNVAWSGTDIGAGIVRYDVYVRTDGGAWVLWLDDTALTSAAWDGAYGHSYGFYAVATDGAGWNENTPTAATASQASITVPPKTNFLRVITATAGQVKLEFVGTPGERWRIERALAPTENWEDRGIVEVGGNGIAPFTDSDPIQGSAFYHAVRQSP